jgi:hypothetical protein
MPLECNVACLDTGITLTNAYTKVDTVTAHEANGQSEANLSVYKDNTTTNPVFRLRCIFPTDMSSGTDGEGVNPFAAAEDALVSGTATLGNANYSSTFVGATIVA